MHHQLVFARELVRGLPITTVRQICVSWPPTLGVISASTISPGSIRRSVEGCTARLCGERAQQQEIVLGAERLHVHLSSTASSSSLIPGRAISISRW